LRLKQVGGGAGVIGACGVELGLRRDLPAGYLENLLFAREVGLGLGERRAIIAIAFSGAT